METTREIALSTYKEAIAHGMTDTPMNWHIWKRAFDTAERELKNLQLGAVSGLLAEHKCKFYVNANWTGYSRCECGKEYKG